MKRNLKFQKLYNDANSKKQMIKHFSFHHGQYYHYRYHLANLNALNGDFSTLKNYLENIHKSCPNEYFKSGPRSSQLKFSLNIEKVEVSGHELSQMTKKAIELNGKSHTNVQVFLLNNDKKTLAVEIPIWLENNEMKEFNFKEKKHLTGHIDIIRKENNNIWVWDYKPNAEKQKYASTQLYFYAAMLSKRTNIPLKEFRCGYFDENIAYMFKPENGRLH